MSFTSKEFKAIQMYCDQHDAVPQLSRRPMVTFKMKSDGSIVEKNINHLLADYERMTKEDSAQRAKQRRDQKAEEARQTWRTSYKSN